MFKSFFPSPKLFFLSAIVWSLVSILVWKRWTIEIGLLFGFAIDLEINANVVGIEHFLTDHAKALYVYCAIVFGGFYGFWKKLSDNSWLEWSILGSQLILVSTYLQVQVAVALNNWRRPFFDKISEAFSHTGITTALDLYQLLFAFAEIAFFAIILYTGSKFFISHYIFRWRTAMNNYYLENWQMLRQIEGASQRVQEDTMRFATIVEGLGIAIVESIMTLIAFIPVLIALSEHVDTIPIVGSIPAPLLTAAIAWSLIGTVLLALVGIKLPGLEFNNQKVEAAFRKELVHGEDDAARAQPMSVYALFSDIRQNYFRLYFHYMYFNLARGFYLQADTIFTYIILVPTIVAGAITYGLLQQILTALSQVSNSFQFLVNSWTTIVELLSVRKRLLGFESNIDRMKIADEEAGQVPAIG